MRGGLSLWSDGFVGERDNQRVVSVTESSLVNARELHVIYHGSHRDEEVEPILLYGSRMSLDYPLVWCGVEAEMVLMMHRSL